MKATKSPKNKALRLNLETIKEVSVKELPNIVGGKCDTNGTCGDGTWV